MAGRTVAVTVASATVVHVPSAFFVAAAVASSMQSTALNNKDTLHIKQYIIKTLCTITYY